MSRYSVRTKAQPLGGEDGHTYWIYDSKRRLVAEGWSRGSKKNALDQARDTVSRLKQFDLSDAETA